MQVRCYWNLHKAVWSVQCAKTRRVILHSSTVVLRDVSFKVSQAGRKRVLAEGRKNVHAFACGELERLDPFAVLQAHREGRTVSYNPRRDTSFVELAGDERRPCTAAARAVLTTDQSCSKAALLAINPH